MLKIRWSLYKVIMLTGILVAIVSSFAGIAALFKMNAIKANTVQLTDQWIPQIIKTGEINTYFALLRKSEWEFVNTTSEKERKKIEDDMDEALGNVTIYSKSLAKLITDPESQKMFDSFSANWDKYSDSHDKFVSAIKAKKQEAGLKILNEEAAPFFSNAQGDLKKLSDANFNGSLKAKGESEKILIDSKWLVGILSAIGLIFSLLICGFIARSITLKIKKAIDKLEEGSAVLSESSKQISNSSIKLSESVTEQVSALHETVSSLDEINNKVQLNNKTTEKTFNASNSNIEVANQGVHNMNEVMNSIQQISNGTNTLIEKINESNKEISGIVTIISEIGEKTKVINDIVFQTRLLSFNASVEAARAGDAGRGFAVVAEEVGKLAQLSGQSSNEITALLQSSIDKVNEIVKTAADQTNYLINSNKSHIESGNETAAKCNESLNQIIQNINEVNVMINNVNTSSSEQGQGLKEIATAISQLSEATSFNSTVAGLTSNEAKTLEKQVTELTYLIDDLSKIV